MNNVKFIGSKTEEFLINSFAFNTQLGCKYNIYAEIASKEGFEKIAQIFSQTAVHKFMHAKLLFNHMENAQEGEVNGKFTYKCASTIDNLYYSICDEEYEFNNVLYNAEETALKEGFDSIASTFKHIKNAQKHHFERFKLLLGKMQNNFFEREEEQIWACQRCGYLYKDKNAPNFCPNCYSTKAYFEVKCEKY